MKEKKKFKKMESGREPSLTDVGVAEGVLRMRQGARATLRHPDDLQAAEDEQQADQLLAHGLHSARDASTGAMRWSPAGSSRRCVTSTSLLRSAREPYI